MTEYYRLMFVRKEIGKLGIPEQFILEIDRNSSSILAYKSEKLGVILVTSGIEKLTEEQAETLVKEINS